MEETNGLDISWITEQQRIQNIQSNYDKEPITDIHVYSLYINNNSSIEKIICKKQPVIDGRIERDVVLGIIQNNKTSASKKYKLVDICLYNVDLEPDHIQSYAKSQDISSSSDRFFKVLPVADEILVPDSIFVFHSLNSLFFFYKEPDRVSHNHTMKSILKPSYKSSSTNKTHTKKVRISSHNQEYDFVHPPRKLKKTRKNIISVSK